MVHGSTVFLGTAAGVAAASALFYFVTIRKAFGGYTPPDQSKLWQAKSTGLAVDGKWPREAAGPVHLNPFTFNISGTEYARNCLKPVDTDDDDDEEE